MNSQQIEYILTLAEERSFSRAAAKLYVTQPSLSQYIASAEKQLGASLFDRSSSPIRLTEAGEAYVRAAEKMRAIEASFRNELADITELKTGTLSIGASTFRASCMLPRSIADFCAAFPGITVNVTEGGTSALAEMLKNNELDVVIGTDSYSDLLFRRESLAAERLYLAAPREMKMPEGTTALTAEEIRSGSLRALTAPDSDLSLIRGRKLIAVDHGEFGPEAIAPFLSAGFVPESTLRVRTVETAFAFTVAGMGVSFIPDSLIKYGNYSENPLYYPIGEAISVRRISLISRKNGYFTRAAREYCLMLKKLVDIGTWRV